MQTCPNISHLLIKTTVPWPKNCSGYIFLCVFRAEFEEVVFFRFSASWSLLPWTYSYGASPLPPAPSTLMKTIFVTIPATSALLNSRACFSPRTWPLGTIYEAFRLPHYLLLASVILVSLLTVLFSLLFLPSESGFLNLCT